MILKDLMEENQLNLNQPLLSVRQRRFSSTLASTTDQKSRLPLPPAYKSELQLVPHRNAGAVPFVWEKEPGRPKDESELQTQAIIEQPPNFPPRRVSQIKKQQSLSNYQSVASLDKKKVTKHSKGETKENESSDSDDEYEAYEDALDQSLSRTESFFMSCGVSGLSGWDEQEVQPLGSFSSDHQQGRDFMIDRFLLAAKAMTSEAPQNDSKKAQQRKQKKKELNAESSCPLNQHRPKPLPHYTTQNIDSEESEDESDDCSEYENSSTTTCGLFPRFCLLNPIPGLKIMDKVQRNAAHEGMLAKSAASHIGSSKEQGRTPHENKLIDSQSDFTEEKDNLDILVKSKHCTDPHERGCSKLVSCESTQHEKTLYVDSVHKVKSHCPSIDSSPEVIESKKIKNSESQVYSREKNSNILTHQNSELDLKRQLAAKWVDEECTLASSKVRYEGKIDLESQCLKKNDLETSGTSCFGIPLGLPSLKAPSDSWLKRTLPTIYARNKTSKTTSSLHPKWDNC